MPGVIAGIGGLTVTDSSNGYGMVVMAGDNTYFGGTDLEAGTLQLGSSTALGDSDGGVIVNGGELDLNGWSIMVGLLEGNGGQITNNNPLATSTLTVDQASNSAYYGAIQDGSGRVGLVMAGSGVLVAAGDNAYSGGTVVSSGLFVATDAAALPAGSALTIGAGGTMIFGDSNGPPPSDQGQGMNSHANGPTANNPTAPAPVNPAPVIASIQCAGESLVDANSVVFDVTFSKPVTGVSPADFSLDGDGPMGVVTSVSGSGDGYAVTVSDISGSGDLGLAPCAGGSLLDWYGTPLDATAGIPVDQQYTIDRELYWDPCDGGASGTGTWDAIDCNWRVGSLSGPLQAWLDGSAAVFAGLPGTVSIASPVVVSSLTFLSDGYVLQGSGITLAPSPPAPLPEGEGSNASTPASDGEGSNASPSSPGEAGDINVVTGSATIDCAISGAALDKTGSGGLALGGADSYSCSTTVSAGLLRLQNGLALPAGTSLTIDSGALDLGGTTTAALTSVTLVSGTILDGTLDAGDALDLYGGAVLADLAGTAGLQKLGPGTVLLAGHNTYQGGTNALDGTLVAAYADSLFGTPTGPGTVVEQVTLYASGNGDWTTGQWELVDGTQVPWLDGSSAVLAAGSDLSITVVIQT